MANISKSLFCLNQFYSQRSTAHNYVHVDYVENDLSWKRVKDSQEKSSLDDIIEKLGTGLHKCISRSFVNYDRKITASKVRSIGEEPPSVDQERFILNECTNYDFIHLLNTAIIIRARLLDKKNSYILKIYDLVHRLFFSSEIILPSQKVSNWIESFDKFFQSSKENLNTIIPNVQMQTKVSELIDQTTQATAVTRNFHSFFLGHVLNTWNQVVQEPINPIFLNSVAH